MLAEKPATASSPLWTRQELAEVVGADFVEGPDIFGIAIDSRDVRAGDLFVAMPGTAVDGHSFVEKALTAGAHAALVRRDWDAPEGLDASKLIACNDPKAGLIALGVASRARTKGQVIGVTGSVGKTSLKEALFRCLGREKLAHTNVRSFNNDVGVPVTLARMPRETQFGIFEMGMNHAGELTELSGWVRPHVALITTVASAHAEFFDSEEGIADAKAEIFIGLAEGGTAILNLDNRHYERLRAAAKKAGAARIITFGMNNKADIHARRVVPHGHCTTLVADISGETMLLKVGIPGQHWVMNALATLAVVYALDEDTGLAALSLAEMKALPGRGQISAIPVGEGEATLIDDSYNANPASVRASLEMFGALELKPRARRIAVLGDMLELGDMAPRSHADLAAAVVDAKVDILVTVGPLMENLAEACAGKANVHPVDDKDAALKLLHGQIRSDDAVLIKGSNSIGLGAVVAALKEGAR